MANPFANWKPEDVERHNRRLLTARQHNQRVGVGEYEYRETGGASPGAESEPVVRHESLGAATREEAHATRLRVRIISRRRRLLDPDNLTGGCKYFLDCCRYAGLIPDDRPQDITLEVTQEKVRVPAEEVTIIEILTP